MNTDGENDFFPDPLPSIPQTEHEEDKNGIDQAEMCRTTSSIHLNDVSRMSAYPNGTPVSKFFFPRCEEDVLDILQAAHSEKKQVGIRGTKHSMG